MASTPSLRRAQMMMMVPPVSMHPILLAIDDVARKSVGVGRFLGGVAPRESRRRRRSVRHFFVLLL